MAKITYNNKVSLNPQPSIANINKVSDADMNEIKNSVNALYDISTGQATIDVATTAVEINAYAKTTNVASIKLIITITNQISANATTQIAHGLPIPNAIYGDNGWEFIGMNKNDKSNMRCRVDKGGKLTLFWLNNQLAAGSQLYFYTTYITD